jgi:hypothetical protein
MKQTSFESLAWQNKGRVTRQETRLFESNGPYAVDGLCSSESVWE